MLCDLCSSLRAEGKSILCDECAANTSPAVEVGVERRTIDELFESPTPLSIVAAHRVTDGYSLELSDGRTLFLSSSLLTSAGV
jgi:hypothetical protein